MVMWGERFDSASPFNVELEREARDMRRALAAICVSHRLTTHWTGAEIDELSFVNLDA
jgi:hypothetical protein